MKAERIRPVLITGGSGFIGTNLAHRLLSDGRPVLVFDNLSRPGVERNLRWLQATHPRLLRVEIGDVRDRTALRRAVSDAGAIFHLAAQVAVTSSLVDPLFDFDVNARGTLNLLEAARAATIPLPIVFTSTNKVYGALEDLALEPHDTRYLPCDPGLRTDGVNEERPLEFHSPYGCSKGAAEQYVLDYAHVFGLPAVVFRMSCIYGPHQFGTEDQGWLAHFLISALAGRPITLYGDGKQVRDALWVEDLVTALLLAQANADRLAGQAFNLGGGAANTISLLELVRLIEELHGEPPQLRFEPWRPADQRYYVSDTRRFQVATGWRAAVGLNEGLDRLHRWIRDARITPAVPAERSRRAAGGGQAATWSRP